jgi:hypothetical protein
VDFEKGEKLEKSCGYVFRSGAFNLRFLRFRAGQDGA